jgi:hypothetical protein
MECDEVIHVGDAVGIGPHPAEVVSLLTDRGVRCVMGNHDEIAAFGLPKPLPPWMSEGEAEHQRWTHDQLTQAQLEAVRYPQSCPKADESPSRYTRNPSDYDGLGNLIDVTSVEPRASTR